MLEWSDAPRVRALAQAAVINIEQGWVVLAMAKNVNE